MKHTQTIQHDGGEQAARLPLQAACNSFLNALVREWPQWQYFEDPVAAWRQLGIHTEQGGICVHFPTSAVDLWLPVQHYSAFHLHGFHLPMQARTGQGGWHETDLVAVARWTACEPLLGASLHYWVGQPSALRACLFQERVANSTACILKSAAGFEAGPSRINDFQTAEQALLYGHCVHPFPKYREGFCDDEAVRYLPEFQAHFPVLYIAVAAELLWHTAAPEREVTTYLLALTVHEPDIRARCPHGFVLLPMHPWQWGKLAGHHFIQAALVRQHIQIMGCGQQPWFPTTSVRALYQANCAYMLKFSLSSRMTNSKRVLKETEVVRGVWVHRAFTSSLGQVLMRRCPSLRVMYEPISFAIQQHGRPIAESFVVLRHNPFPEYVPAFAVATICQGAIGAQESVIVCLVRQYADSVGQAVRVAALSWFKQYLEIAVAPFIVALSDFGFLFSVHQQNMVLLTENGLPVCVYFRDCQGTAFTAEAVARLRQEITAFPLDQDLDLPADEVLRLSSYYLFVNNVFAVAAAFQREGLLTDKQSTDAIRDFLQALKGCLNRDGFIDYLLHSEHLHAKGNLVLSLLDINETQVPQASFQSYVPLLNPLYRCAQSD